MAVCKQRATLTVFAYLFAASCYAGSTEDAVEQFTKQLMNEFERNADKDIQGFCADEWPDDFQMQNYCYESNAEARNKAQSYDLINGPRELMGIWGTCMSKWKDPKDRPNWQMVTYCIETQVEALAKIKQRQSN